MQCKGYLIPCLPHRLLPPQNLVRDEHNEWYKINDKRAILEFKDGYYRYSPGGNPRDYFDWSRDPKYHKNFTAVSLAVKFLWYLGSRDQ